MPTYVLLLPVLMLVAIPALAYEEPAYSVIAEADGYELRQYEPYLVAETVVRGGFNETGNRAFRRLAGYIFGDNTVRGAEAESTKMAMTIPVTRHRADSDEGAYVYRFVMEKAYSLDTLPVPNAESVTLTEVSGGLVAARRYSGRTTESNYNKELAELRSALTRDGLNPADAPISAVYNGPFTLPFLRRNEVLIPVRDDQERRPSM